MSQIPEEKIDLIYVDCPTDGSSINAVWSNIKNRFSKFAIIEGYYEGNSSSKGGNKQHSYFIDKIESDTKELIAMDRRIFFDDRGYTDEQIDYGSVLIRNPDFDIDTDLFDW